MYCRDDFGSNLLIKSPHLDNNGGNAQSYLCCMYRIWLSHLLLDMNLQKWNPNQVSWNTPLVWKLAPSCLLSEKWSLVSTWISFFYPWKILKLNDYTVPLDWSTLQSNCPEDEVNNPALTTPEATSIDAARLSGDSEKSVPLKQTHVKYNAVDTWQSLQLSKALPLYTVS
jgi:hypothetical protein